MLLYLLMVLSSTTNIMSTAALAPPCFLVVPLSMVAPQLVYDILCIGDALGQDPVFTLSRSDRESLMLSDHS